jgi:hypothetical protein
LSSRAVSGVRKVALTPFFGGGFPPGTQYIRLLPNDPEVTRVSDVPATGPLKVEVAEIAGSSCNLFCDGFESALYRSRDATGVA